jgi:hypothetical protein
MAEELEHRIAPATFAWKGPSDGTGVWSNPNNWLPKPVGNWNQMIETAQLDFTAPGNTTQSEDDVAQVGSIVLTNGCYITLSRLKAH